MNQVPRFFVHSGLGDTGWLFQKLQDNLPEFNMTISDYGPRRSHGYIRLLGCKHVGYSKNHTPDDIKRLRLPHDTDLTILNYSKPHVLSVNEWMEQGNRIDDWLPMWPTKYTLDFMPIQKYTDQCNQFLNKYSKDDAKRIVVYTSSKENNAHKDVQFYSNLDWVYLIEGMQKHFGEDTVFIIVGAEYDRSCTDEVVRALHRNNIRYINAVGVHIGVTIELIKAADACISYPSGIGITADFVGTPVCMGMFAKIKKMHYMWQSKERIENRQTINFCLSEKHKFPDLIKELQLL